MNAQHYLQPLSSIAVNYIQVVTVTYYKPGQVLQMGVNIHVAFLISTLDFKTHSSGQMLLKLQWGKLKHNRFVFKIA